MRLPLIFDKDGHPVTTEVSFKTPWYMRVGNLVIPLTIIGPGIFALLSAFGISPLLSLAAITLMSVASLVAISWLGPVIYNRLRKPKNTYNPQRKDLNELQRRYLVPSTMRSFDWTLRITVAATGFALVAVLIALFVLNPAGAIVGTSVLELIHFNMIPLAIAGLTGAVFGSFVGILWRKFALQFALRTARTNKALNEENPERVTIEDSYIKSEKKELERRWYLFTKHDEPLYFRIAFGALLGVAAATFISLALMSSGGLGAPLFAVIALCGPVIASVSPYIGRGFEWLFSIKRKLVIAESAENKDPVTGKNLNARIWFGKSTLDVSWYIRLFLGIGAGLAMGSLFGGVAVIIAPIVGASLSLLSPLFFAALEKVGFTAWLKRKDGLFAPTEHHSLDMPWFGRLFNGAGAGAAISVAALALGAASPVAIGIGIALPVLALATPFLFAVFRQIPKPEWLKTMFSPGYQSEHAVLDVNHQPKKTKKGVTKLRENKLLAYGQWYVRVAIGGMVGAMIGLGFGAGMGFLASPLAVPLAVVVTAAFFWIAQPAYKGAKALFHEWKRRTAAAAPPAAATTESTATTRQDSASLSPSSAGNPTRHDRVTKLRREAAGTMPMRVQAAGETGEAASALGAYSAVATEESSVATTRGSRLFEQRGALAQLNPMPAAQRRAARDSAARTSPLPPDVLLLPGAVKNL